MKGAACEKQNEKCDYANQTTLNQSLMYNNIAHTLEKIYAGT